MTEVKRLDLGAVSAYALAVEKGYTGTEEEFAELLTNTLNYATQARGSASAAAGSAEEAGRYKTQAGEILASVNLAGTQQIEAIEAAGTQQTNAAKEAIEAKGKETLDSIPDSYEALQGDVTQLQGDLVKLDNVVGVTEKKQGLLNGSGGIETTTENFYYAEFFNVKQNDKFIYSGSWGAWGLVFGYKADGTSVQLLSSGTYNDKEIIIESTDIITIRAWSNCDYAELKFEKLNSLFFDVEENKSKIETIELDVDWLNSTCQYYQESEINPSDYDNNTKIIRFRETLPVGSNIRIKIIAESSGYIAAIVRNGGTETSIKINSTLVNIGDVLAVNGVSDTNISEIYIYSPNGVKCKVFILITNKPKNEIIVDANGYGDYRSLDDAIANANDSKENPVVIRVRPGIYYTRTETPSDIPYVKKNRYISIIGDSKNNCTIRNDNGYYSPYTDDSYGMLYDSTPIRLSGMVTIENLTIISTMSNFENWVSDHSTEVKGNNGANSYCIHIDFDAPENSVALVKNCILVNDHYSCIGAGNRKNYTINIEDCELTSTIDGRVSAPDNGSTIFVHSYNLNSGNAYDGQNIFIKNNIIKNTNKHNACYFYASAPDRMYCTLIGNVCKTSDNSQAFVSIGNAYGITKTDLCFGNNVDSMN